MVYKSRRYQRYSAEGSVALEVKKHESCSIAADLIDISFTGMYVCSEKRIEPGSRVKFELASKLISEPITGEGEIKYAKKKEIHSARPFRIGIEFIAVDGDAIEHLINKIQRRIVVEKRKKEAKRKSSMDWDW